jgi:YaiO family outer membrane protein
MKKVILIGVFLAFVIGISAQEKGHFQVLTGYEGDSYSEPYERHFNVFSAGFGYKGNLTAIYGKFNLGYLNGETTLSGCKQFELDYYQSLTRSKSTTFWLNYAYSPDEVFPTHRITYEVWQKLPANFLISAGGNHYFFDETATIFNVGLEYYFSRYWVGFKTYLQLKDPKVTTSYTLTGRVFFKDVNYLQLGVGIGAAQDEPFLLPSDLYRLDARTVKIAYVQNIFKEKMQLRTGFTYGYEEYLEDQWRNRYSFGIGLIFNIR